MTLYQWIAVLCGGLSIAANAQTLIESFEYATDDDLLAAWMPSSGATISLSDAVAPKASGPKAMRIDFNFASSAWATETIRGADLPAPISISPTQYVTFRLHGDPKFAATDFQYLYLYAYDTDGNFGRWGAPVPLLDEWQILNFKADPMEQPWDSPGLPDLTRISRFAFFQYGSQGAVDAYSATIYLDDLMIRNTPLIEFPPASAPGALLDNFESYKDNAALQAFYTYQNSPSATTTTASLDTPAPEGAHALKLSIDFASGQWPWGSVWSSKVTPFSIPTNATVSFRVKGDPALAAVADAGTEFWLSFADKAGGRINFITDSSPLVSSNWTTLHATLADFSNTDTVDVGNLVQWRLLVEGWQGTADSPAMSAAVSVDDLRISTTTGPKLSIVRQGANWILLMENLTAGSAYDLRTCTQFSDWSTSTTINATASTASWTVTPNQPCAFYQLVQPQ